MFRRGFPILIKRAACWRQSERPLRWDIFRRDTMRALSGVGGRKLSETGCSYRITNFLQARTFYSAGMLEIVTHYRSGGGDRMAGCQDVGTGSPKWNSSE